MFQIIKDLPDNVIGVAAAGKITGADYETILIPEIEDKLKRHKKLNCLYQMGEDFEGFEPAALWDDAKVGMSHPLSWDRVACVTDVEWIRHAAKAFGLLSFGHMRIFKNSESGDAINWVSGTDVSD